MEEGPLGMKTSVTGQPLQSFEVDCPSTLVGRVIGAHGATIKDLQLRSGAKIHVNQDVPEGAPRKVVIAGTPEAVALAATMVQTVMEHGPSGLAHAVGVMGLQGQSMPAGGMPQGYGGPPGYSGLGAAMGAVQAPLAGSTHSMDCPKQVVGKLIGRGGETIQLIQSKSGCRVQIDQNVPEGMPCKINMHGTPQTIQNAVQIVTEIMTNGVTRIQNMPSLVQPTPGYPGAQGMYMQQPMGYAMPQQQPQHHQSHQQQQQIQQYHSYQQQYAQSTMQQYPPQYSQQYPGMQPQAQGRPPQPGGAPSPWSEHTHEGHKYWYNSVTRQSTWTKPY